jgi:hypothetical protein
MRFYSVKRLTGQHIINAQRLLHKIYKEEQGWDPAPNNPSGVHYLDGRLRDNFESTAVWLGAYKGGELIGCMRLILGDMEIQQYIDIPYDETVLEISRRAILKEHRGGMAQLLMGIRAYWYSAARGYTRMYGAPPVKEAQKAHIYGWVDTGKRFKYVQTDTEYRAIVYLDLSLTQFLLYILRYIRNLLKF